MSEPILSISERIEYGLVTADKKGHVVVSSEFLIEIQAALNSPAVAVEKGLIERVRKHMKDKPVGCDASYILWTNRGTTLLEEFLQANADTISISRELFIETLEFVQADIETAGECEAEGSLVARDISARLEQALHSDK